MTLPRGERDREVIGSKEQTELRSDPCWKEKRGFFAKGKLATEKLVSVKFARERPESVKLVRERLGRGR